MTFYHAMQPPAYKWWNDFTHWFHARLSYWCWHWEFCKAVSAKHIHTPTKQWFWAINNEGSMSKMYAGLCAIDFIHWKKRIWHGNTMEAPVFDIAYACFEHVHTHTRLCISCRLSVIRTNSPLWKAKNEILITCMSSHHPNNMSRHTHTHSLTHAYTHNVSKNLPFLWYGKSTCMSLTHYVENDIWNNSC